MPLSFVYLVHVSPPRLLTGRRRLAQVKDIEQIGLRHRPLAPGCRDGLLVTPQTCCAGTVSACGGGERIGQQLVEPGGVNVRGVRDQRFS